MADSLEKLGINRFLFVLDDVGQFDITFSVWIHEDEHHLLKGELEGTDGVDPAEMMKQALKGIKPAGDGGPIQYTSSTCPMAHPRQLRSALRISSKVICLNRLTHLRVHPGANQTSVVAGRVTFGDIVSLIHFFGREIVKWSRPYFDIDAYAAGKHCSSTQCHACKRVALSLSSARHHTCLENSKCGYRCAMSAARPLSCAIGATLRMST